jgi:hypothetical protein
MNRFLVALIPLIGLAAGSAQAAESVDLELVFLADASRSIDDAELMFQRQGYAAAITHPEILNAIASGFDRRIAVTYVEWADDESQHVLAPLAIVDGLETAAAFADALMRAPRESYGSNAIGSAISKAHMLIESNDIQGYRRVIDFSGDSANSFSGIPVALARQLAVEAGIVINGLAVLCWECSGPPVDYDLVTAFEQEIIGGPGAFVLSADNAQRFAEAVRRKLLLEISGLKPTGPRSAGLSLRQSRSAPD